MYAQFFGNYLLSRNIVTREQLIEAMRKKSSSHIRLGTLAIHAGYMTASEVNRVIVLQTHEDKRFGEIAINEGYLTELQVAELLSEQKPDFLLLGQALVEDGVIDHEEFQNLIIDYQSDNDLTAFEYSTETKEAIRQMIEHFFVLAERPLSTHEISLYHLLMNSLVRFIGDDFTPVPPILCQEYPANYCVSQEINGAFSVHTYLDIPESACIDFASRYVGETFTEFDEYVRASLEDFLNLLNGLFIVNMSNDCSIELTLDPPVVEETESLLTFQEETYLLPIVYPFGTIYFIITLHNRK